MYGDLWPKSCLCFYDELVYEFLHEIFQWVIYFPASNINNMIIVFYGDIPEEVDCYKKLLTRPYYSLPFSLTINIYSPKANKVTASDEIKKNVIYMNLK